MEKYREKKKDLHTIFINLEKAYDSVSRDLLWWVLEKKCVSTNYTDVIKYMYDIVAISVRTIVCLMSFLLA